MAEYATIIQQSNLKRYDRKDPSTWKKKKNEEKNYTFIILGKVESVSQEKDFF